MTDSMILVTGVYPVGGHLAGWRHPTAYPDIAMNLDAMIELARLAERGRIQALFLADGNAVRQMDKPALFEAVAPSDRPASFEPTTVMAAIAQHTAHVGLFATATTTYEQPYLLARKFASLDHISGGRAIWNVVTGSYPGDAVNFGGGFPERTDRYRRAGEFLDVCKGLWDSWADDAFPQDKASGRFLDSSRVHVLDHVGENFAVRGPLNVARSPQGHPVLFMAGQSGPGRDLAAQHADCLFTVAQTKEESLAAVADIKGRVAAFGRDPAALKIIPGIRVNVAGSREQALDLYRELNALVSPALGVEYLSSQVKQDLSGYPLDGPMPDLSTEVAGVTSIRQSIGEMAAREGLTVRQTYQRLLAADEDPPFTGTAAEVADEMEDWFRSGACDGFMMNVPTLPLGLERVVDLLVPELQRRGLFHDDYTGGTLREELRLPVLRNAYFDTAHAGSTT
ncbi:LLM class flavin-dependent oxidoreductase [Pseudonocardia xishanensis]|uniref:LLM class flavin-dependent oxidoreductase n=1 Tax=Pseudonocardia xishanensis TaxID=630995 RepID=A0ABP8S2J1_9PSEU